METHVAQYWDTAQMALKPVDKSEDGTSLTVEVYWMPTTSYGYSTAICSRPELKHTGSKDAQVELYNPVGKKKMESGHRVTFETDDPENYPLPAWELLEMRWDLNRIAKLAGVVEMYGRDDYESEEGESSDEEEEEEDEDEVEYKDDSDDSEEGDDNGKGGGISVMGFFPGLGRFLPLTRPGTDGKLFKVDEEKLKKWEEKEKEDGGPEPESHD